MKFSFSPTTLAAASLAAVAFIGTSAVQVQAVEKDIPTTAIDNGSFTTLVAALGATDLVDALSEPNGPFTVFAPTDDAFDALPNGLVECLLEPENKDSLSAILTYHVVSGKVLSSDLMDGMTATTLQGDDVTVDLSDGGVKINDSTVVTADVLATNGVIHVISSVLVPPSIDVTAFLETCATTALVDDIPSTAIGAGIFNTLVAALGAADLVDALSDPNGPFTVFAPTDDAFAALPEELVTCLLEPENKDSLTAILTYHVVDGQVLSTDLTDGMMAPTLQGEDVTVDLSEGVKINDSTVVTADVLAKNGVIHIIDAVLVPPSIDVDAFLKSCSGGDDIDEPTLDIPGTAIAAGVFNTLVTALGAADLVDALSTEGPFTVFAPSDEAFAALPTVLVTCLLEPENKDALTAVLTYHVVSGQVLSTQLEDGMTATTLQGEDVTVDLSDGDVKINDSEVVFADVLTTNGVIHVIDAVLVPPSIDVDAFLKSCSGEDDEPEPAAPTAPTLDIPDTAIEAGVFTTLVAALGAADLVGALQGEGPFTVFAPTDDAFAALPEELVTCLLQPDNKVALTSILTYHVVSGQVLSIMLEDGMEAATLQGEDVTVDLSDGVKINDSKVIIADVLTTNGVIHVIDAVLVPPSIDVAAFLETCGNDEPEPIVVDECTYLGVSRSAGQYLTGPSHTCLCQSGGHWIECKTNSPEDLLQSIEEFVLMSNEFTTLEAAVVQAGLVGVLDGDGPYTLFAPTDAAFADVPTAVLDFLLDDANKDVLGKVLAYHVLSGSVDSNDVPVGTTDNIETLLGGSEVIVAKKTCFSSIKVEAGTPPCDDYSLLLNGNSNVIVTDIETANGVVHVIDTVLIPPSLVEAVANIVEG